MNAMIEPAEEAAGDEFLISRTFDAPRSLVFRAWTDPVLMARWWGPECFTNPVCEMDLRPGGIYRIVMRSPDGADFPMSGEYREIVDSERIIMTVDTSEHPDSWQDLVIEKGGAAAGMIVQMVTFEEANGRTVLAVRSRFESFAIRDALLGMGMAEGWSQSLESLNSLLAEDREVVTERVIDAPRALVFSAFSDASRLAKWWGPDGFTSTFRRFDFRPGGHWEFVMHGPDGTDYDNHSIFDEVVEPERIVFRHLGPVHAFQMTVLIADEAGRTKLTWRMLFETAEHCAAVKGFVAFANEQNFDRLKAELAKMKAPRQ